MTKLPDTLGHYISVYKQAKEAVAAYEFEGGGAYLFAGRDGRAFAVSSWTTVVKETFKRHSGGLAPPPKLLRAIFIVWLRDQAHTNSATPEILKVYKLATHTTSFYTSITFLPVLFRIYTSDL
mmetsp:Transcript_25651/g.59846  ORF Transcript_25651/g.59846 Transcript_25651/m.59846 type:complete len:123 (-) Transcript_25651:1408-1776(-)